MLISPVANGRPTSKLRRKVTISPEASQDLQRIHDTLTDRFGLRRADLAVDRLYEHCRGFDMFPQRGHRRDDLRPGLRLVGFRRHVTIAFVVEAGEVTILRIFESGRDVAFDG